MISRSLCGWAAALAAATLGCAGPGARDLPAGGVGALAAPAARVPATAPGDQPPALSDRSGLSDYVAYAALNNPGLRAGFHRWQAALARVPQARALPDPQLTYRYWIQRMMSGPDDEVRQTFGLSQMLPWFGKLDLRGQVALHEAQAEFGRLESDRLRLRYQVKQAYYEYAYLGQALARTEENVRLLEYLEKVSRARYKAAAEGHPDVIRTQVELAKLDNDSRGLRDMLGPAAARLNALLDRPASAPLPVPARIDEPTVAASDDELRAWLDRSNPQLRALDAQVARQQRAVELAGKEYFPDLTVGVDFDDMTRMPGAMASGRADDGWSVMAMVNVPIWWDKYAAGVREARAMHHSAVKERADAANLLAADLKMAAYRYRDARRRVDLYGGTLLPKAREAFQAIQAAYQAGTAGFLDLVEAQRLLLEFQLAQQRALADAAQRVAELEMIVGREIPSQPPVEKGRSR